MAAKSSFSQHNIFQKCKRWWFYQYVNKLYVLQDLTYANAGNAVHKTLEEYYSNKRSIEESKIFFNKKWLEYKLDKTLLQMKSDVYWLMCIEGIQLGKDITSTEFTIFYPEIVGHLDGINTNTDEIYDWKTSTRTSENMEEYTQQMFLYAYLYYRKFGRAPKKIIVYYLKYNGSNAELVIVPTMKDIINSEDWYFKILGEMNHIVSENKCPEKCEQCAYFCPYKNMCSEDKEGKFPVILELQGNYIFVNAVLTPLLHKGLDKKFSYTLKDIFFMQKHNPNYDGVIHFWNMHKQLIPIGFMKELKISLQNYCEYKKLQLDLKIVDRRKFNETKVIMPDKFVNGRELRPYQNDAVEEYLRNKISLLEIGTGSGKCFGKGTEILMFDGTTKKIENIKVGDLIMGDDSTYRKVKSTTFGKERMYDIIPVKGKKYTVNESHILSLKGTNSGTKKNRFSKKKVDISILDYINSTKTDKDILKGYRVGVDFKKQSVPIDPYWLGLWLGDGRYTNTEITNPDKEIINYIYSYAKKLSLGVSIYIDKRKECKTYCITNGRGTKNKLFLLLKKLKLLKNKHIPDIYKYNSKKIRLKLLAGLLDFDGYMHHNNLEIVQKKNFIADDILFLARSLGLAAYKSKKIGTIKSINFFGAYNRITISGNVNIIPLKVKRKKGKKRLQKKDVLVTGIKVIPKGIGKYYGVELYGPKKRFLLSDFTVVHNTEIAIEIIRKLGIKTLFIVDKIELLVQTKKRIEDCLGIKVGAIGAGENDIQDITVGTIQTLVKHAYELGKYLYEVRFVIFDECHKTSSISYQKISKYLVNTEYRMGLSGTAYRDDKRDMDITAVTGYKCFDLSAKKLIDNGWLMNPKINFIKINMTAEKIKELEHNSNLGLINETEKYALFYANFISENPIRNKLIVDIIKENKDKKILILTKLIEHGAYLSSITGGVHLYGSTNKEERKQMLEDFKAGKNNILVSTLSIFSEGIDLPDLNLVCNAAANRGDVKTIQVLGRVLRKSEGKDMAEYYDFIDESRFFKIASNARMRAFKREGYDITTKSL